MKPTNISKIIVLIMVAAIGVFAWRKVTTIPTFDAPPAPAPALSAQLALAVPAPGPAAPGQTTPEQPGAEAAAAAAQAPAVDHSAYDALLGEVVRDGLVDYARLRQRADVLDAYLQTLSEARSDHMTHDELLALYINAYNAATLRLILDHSPGIDSIRDIPEDRRWKDARWSIAGEKLSLDDIEHKILLQKLAEPRIHYAIVRGSKGCPVLRQEAYLPSRLNEQLDDQARQVHRDARYVQWDAATRTLKLSPLFDWFKEDFTRDGRSLLDAVARFCDPEVAESLRSAASDTRITYLDWDWSLNERAGPPEWSILARSEDRTLALQADGTTTDLPHAARLSETSPDGSQMLYASGEDIYVAESNGDHARRLASGRELGWSPDGRRIVFASRQTGRSQICTMNRDGSDVRQITDHHKGAHTPRFSIDGRIAFLALGDKRLKKDVEGWYRDLILIDGTDSKTIGQEVEAFAWSPDGRQLVYSKRGALIFHDIDTDRDEARYLQVADGNSISVTHTAPSQPCSYAAGSLRWRPDGRVIACRIGSLGGRFAETHVLGEDEVFVIPLDGQPQRLPLGREFSILGWIQSDGLQK